MLAIIAPLPKCDGKPDCEHLTGIRLIWSYVVKIKSTLGGGQYGLLGQFMTEGQHNAVAPEMPFV